MAIMTKLRSCTFCFEPIAINKKDSNSTLVEDGEIKTFKHICNHNVIDMVIISASKKNDIFFNWIMLHSGKNQSSVTRCKFCNVDIDDEVVDYNNDVFVHNCQEWIVDGISIFGNELDGHHRIEIKLNTSSSDNDVDKFISLIWQSLNTCYDGDCLEQAEPNGYCDKHQIPF